MARNGLPMKDVGRRTGDALGDEYDFSCGAALENFLMSARGFSQRQFFRDDGTQHADGVPQLAGAPLAARRVERAFLLRASQHVEVAIALRLGDGCRHAPPA